MHLEGSLMYEKERRKVQTSTSRLSVMSVVDGPSLEVT